MPGRDHDSTLEDFWPAYVDILMVVSLILILLVLAFVLNKPDDRVHQEQKRRKTQFEAAFHQHMRDEEKARLVSFYSPPGETQTITFSDQLLFDSGDAELRRPQGRASLKKLAALFSRYIYLKKGPLFETVVVNGHTDEDPISTVRYPSNWHLSSARATSVVYFFVQNGLNPQMLSAVGYAQFRAWRPVTRQPIANKAQKRRIEVVLSYPEAFIAKQMDGAAAK